MALFTDRAHGEIRGGMSEPRFLACTARGDAAGEHRGVRLRRCGARAARRLQCDRGARDAGLWRALGVRPRSGRDFTDADGRPGAPAVALVSERFAHGHAAADGGSVGDIVGNIAGDIVGRTLRVDGVPTLVVGVLPARGELPVGVDFWRPLSLRADAPRDERSLQGVGRLKRGATFSAARAELAAVGRDESRRFPATDGELATQLDPIAKAILDPISPVFQRIACVAVLLTLLVVVANLAGLQLARGAARRREWAVRAAIGASPARLARQSMVESLLLTAAGGFLAWWVAGLTVKAVLMSMSPDITRYIPGWSGIGVDGTLLLLVVGVAITTGLAFGWVPALHASRAAAAAALRGGGSGSLAGVHARSRAALVTAEVALSLALLVSGVLMLDGFRRLGGSELGFEPRGVLTAQVTCASAIIPTPARVSASTRCCSSGSRRCRERTAWR